MENEAQSLKTLKVKICFLNPSFTISFQKSSFLPATDLPTFVSLTRNMAPIEELVRQCLRNNASAQKQLYDRYAPQMMGVCYRYARNRDEAHEILQEGFVRVFTNLDKWKKEGELGAWMRRIMVNTALNWIRDSKKWDWDDEEKIEVMPPESYGESPLEMLQAKELIALIKTLPEGYQAVFNLHAVEGYSHVEIAALLGISEGTSRSQYMRARRHLAEKIKNLAENKRFEHVARK